MTCDCTHNCNKAIDYVVGFNYETFKNDFRISSNILCLKLLGMNSEVSTQLETGFISNESIKPLHSTTGPHFLQFCYTCHRSIGLPQIR